MGKKNINRKVLFSILISFLIVLAFVYPSLGGTVIITDGWISDSTFGNVINTTNGWVHLDNGTFVNEITVDGRVLDSVDFNAWDLGGSGFNDSLFVSKSGNDANSGTEGSPFLTIQHAVDTATAGVTIYVMNGDYNEDVDFGTDGTNANWITLRNYPGHHPVINGNGLFANQQFDGLIHIDNHCYIRISGMNITNCTDTAKTELQDAIFGVDIEGGYAAGCHHIRIDNCTISNMSSAAVKVDSDNMADRIRYITIDNNTCYNININGSQEGISISQGNYVEIKYNTVYDCFKEAIDVKSGSDNSTIHHNWVNTTGIIKVFGVTPFSRHGIYTDGYDSINRNISIYNNYVEGNHTGIKVGAESHGYIEYVYVYNNILNMSYHAFHIGSSATDGDYDHIYIYNNVFYADTASANALKIDRPEENLSNFHISNNILFVEDQAQAFYLKYWDDPSECNFTHNSLYYAGGAVNGYWDSQPGSTKFGLNNVSTDPLFYDRFNGCFWLNTTSDCLDAGNNSLYPSLDYDDYYRPINGTVDIGAFENLETMQDFNEFIHRNDLR